MNRILVLCGTLLIGCTLSGCMERGSQAPAAKIAIDAAKSGELALKFLQGSQNGDKAVMYAASNLTAALVDESREKLVHQTQAKLSDIQRKEYEEILRTSGQIDYFNGKLRKLFPKTADLKIAGTKSIPTTTGAAGFDHAVTVTYNDRNDALSDKTGRAVKVMTVHLVQQSSSIGGRLIHSFSFDTKGFERFADKDFEVVTYY